MGCIFSKMLHFLDLGTHKLGRSYPKCLKATNFDHFNMLNGSFKDFQTHMTQ